METYRSRRTHSAVKGQSLTSNSDLVVSGLDVAKKLEEWQYAIRSQMPSHDGLARPVHHHRWQQRKKVNARRFNAPSPLQKAKGPTVVGTK